MASAVSICQLLNLDQGLSTYTASMTDIQRTQDGLFRAQPVISQPKQRITLRSLQPRRLVPTEPSAGHPSKFPSRSERPLRVYQLLNSTHQHWRDIELNTKPESERGTKPMNRHGARDSRLPWNKWTPSLRKDGHHRLPIRMEVQKVSRERNRRRKLALSQVSQKLGRSSEVSITSSLCETS